ncbi:hypothetical protein MMC30_006995 [Trapelia coarctata]|nr:hypothetical protein [Trapelia coarctata]
MLHELLLALSGHKSPLLSDDKDTQQLGSLLCPSEDALLRSIARLGNSHIELLKEVSTITDSHSSVICRAVSRTIESGQLAEFQQAILKVESRILQKNAALVGAYDIVPLSSVVGAFSGWGKKMEWLKSLVLHIQPRAVDLTKKSIEDEKNIGTKRHASGAQIIKWLRKESQTGYPDIERMAVDLIKVAERAWLRQVSAWVLYGRLPELGAGDFLIQKDSHTGSGTDSYRVQMGLCPAFVNSLTANSILFIGKSLNYIRTQGQITPESQVGPLTGEAPLLSSHLKHLSALEHPINAVSLAAAIANIRSSLSQNVLQKLLPLADIRQVLNVMTDFFLLERGDFAVALIASADECLSARSNRVLDAPSHSDALRFGGIMIKEGEVTNVLNRTWATLAALQDDDDDDVDEELDQARDIIRLSIKKHTAPPTTSFLSSAGPFSILEEVKTTFGDVLLATPASLYVSVSSPLDLFLGSAEVEAYSMIHSYLLSVRRAHLHLTDLWKLSVLRRIHPSPAKGQANSKLPEQDRKRANKRSESMRSTWAMVSSTAFFLTELGEYLQGEVVSSSWRQFSSWLQPPEATSLSRPPSPGSTEGILSADSAETNTTRDPQSLTIAHRAYLGALIRALILDDTAFTKQLKTMLTRLDHVAALVKRLSVVQQSTELGKSYATEESHIMRSLGDVRVAVEADLHSLVNRLSEIDSHRLDGGPQSTANESKITGFFPWQGGGLYRLLMKLDFARSGVSNAMQES